MNYLEQFKSNINPSTVVSVIVAGMLIGVGSFAIKKLKIAPLSAAVNVATKGSKK